MTPFLHGSEIMVAISKPTTGDRWKTLVARSDGLRKFPARPLLIGVLLSVLVLIIGLGIYSSRILFELSQQNVELAEENRTLNKRLRELAEQNNLQLAQLFINALWPSYAEFSKSAGDLNRTQLRSHPKTLEIKKRIDVLIRDLPLSKIKFYDLQGVTIFSTDPSQIGDNKSDNAGFKLARAGRVNSLPIQRGGYNAYDKTFEVWNLLSTYVPIRAKSPDAAVRGVFELYYKVPPEFLYLMATQPYP